jgi:voltage-gated potassium channel Kch
MQENLWQNNWHWILILLLGLAALVFGYIGYSIHTAIYLTGRTRLDILYMTLQLFFLTAEPLTRPLPWQLEVARFLAPIIPAWAGLKALTILFRDQLAMLRLRFMRNHVVICGLGRKGTQLLKDMRRYGESVVAIERDGDNEYITTCREFGGVVIAGNGTDETILQKANLHRARLLVAICGRDGINIDIAVTAYQLIRKMKRARPRSIRCMIHVVDIKFKSLLSGHSIITAGDDPFEAMIFSVYRNAARHLFSEYPPDRGLITANDPRVVQLVVIGLGQMGEEVILQAAKIGHLANMGKIQIRVIDRDAEILGADFLNRYAQFEKTCEIEFMPGDIDDPTVCDKINDYSQTSNTITSIIICLDKNSQNMTAALNIHKKVESRSVPIYVRLSYDGGFATLLGGPNPPDEFKDRIMPFGTTAKTCTSDQILLESLDRLAAAIHKDYFIKRKAARLERPADDPRMQPWEQLNQNYKESNRQQADHIPIKLNAIGCYSTYGPGTGEQVMAFTDDEVELMAEMEHVRWCAERFLAGWVPGPDDPEKKSNPHLIPWRDLPDEIKEYDREAVINIPAVLARLNGKIYRKPSNEEN